MPWLCCERCKARGCAGKHLLERLLALLLLAAFLMLLLELDGLEEWQLWSHEAQLAEAELACAAL